MQPIKLVNYILKKSYFVSIYMHPYFCLSTGLVHSKSFKVS